MTDPIYSVQNQAPPLDEYDLFATDPALREAAVREGAGWATQRIESAGPAFATPHNFALGRLANEYRPVLHTHDSTGRRSDVVEFHPAWHELMELAVGHGLIALPWTEQNRGAQVARAAIHYLYSQVEVGTACPIAMSFGAVPVLRKFQDDIPDLCSIWLPKLLSSRYDKRFIPADRKDGVLIGMGMTERQGGSDVRENISFAEPVGGRGRGQRYRIRGHKWFLSAPMCDAFLVTAQTAGGVACFFVPRFVDDGKLNALRFQRLKNKLGNHSNASSEAEFLDATGFLLGEEGRGVPTIIEMATHTRLDCVLATAGMQRRALALALHHTRHRHAFGAALIGMPMMRNVLCDLAVESEATTALAMRLARTFDDNASDQDRALGRVLTPAAKFHVCKRGPQFAAEAMEVHGGNGYVEDSELPRIYRELPLLSIWEGSGNVMCLDMLRAIARDRATLEALQEELNAARGMDERLDRFVERLKGTATSGIDEWDGRRLAHAIVLAVQGSLLVAHAPPDVADAFCATRLAAHDWGLSFGTAPAISAADAILERAAPEP